MLPLWREIVLFSYTVTWLLGYACVHVTYTWLHGFNYTIMYDYFGSWYVFNVLWRRNQIKQMNMVHGDYLLLKHRREHT